MLDIYANLPRSFPDLPLPRVQCDKIMPICHIGHVICHIGASYLVRGQELVIVLRLGFVLRKCTDSFIFTSALCGCEDRRVGTHS